MSDKSLLLYAAGTPNSWKATIFVEELKAAYGDRAPAIEIQILDIFKGTQKEPWYLKINPNGRLPALVDRTRKDYAVFESAAIQLYLTEHYDKEHKLSFDPVTASNDYNDMMQWIFFAHGHVGPTLGEVFHYYRGTSEKVPYSLKRYTDETLRLFGVLDTRLKNREFLAGSGVGNYSIADMDAYPWVKSAGYVGIDGLDKLPNLKAWLDRIDARPGAQSGMQVVPPAGSK